MTVPSGAVLVLVFAVVALIVALVTQSVRSRRTVDEVARLRRERDAAAEEVTVDVSRVVAALAGPALVFDAHGYLFVANDRAIELFGETPQSPPPTVMQVTGSTALADAVRGATSTPSRLELSLGGREVDAVVVEVGPEVLVTLRDRSEQRRVDDLRRNFVANASHELKTPAASILSLAEGLQVAMTTDAQHAARVVGHLQTEAERLSRIVHDLLDLRRLEESPTSATATTDLARAVRRTVAELYARAEDREVDVEVEAPDVATVRADTDDVELLARNLVSNAIQYNRPGGSVRVEVVPGHGVVRLVVTDDGLGIPERDLDRIFERFYRVDVARSRDRGGTGLGLSIARHAAERNGGVIEVQSLLGSGSTFTVTLPAAGVPA